MAMPSQELSELKSRVLVAVRTGTNIARVSDYLISLIREAGSSLPERPKSDTDTEYLYSVIIAIESKRKNQELSQVQVTEDPEPTIVEDVAPVIPEPIKATESEDVTVTPEPIELEETPVASEITTVEELDSAEVNPTDNKEAVELAPEHSESTHKTKGGKQPKKNKKQLS